MLNEFLTCMKERGWNVELNQGDEVYLPKKLEERYTNIPQAWLDFISAVKCIKNNEDTTWFLCVDNFEVQRDNAFQWNEWEIISLEGAESDAEWENEIKEFWNSHLPIILSVNGGYSYYAIFMKDGSIVQGEEPEFEECTKVANSFDEFMKKIIEKEIFIG